jgi:hypothetical protein
MTARDDEIKPRVAHCQGRVQPPSNAPAGIGEAVNGLSVRAGQT